MCSNVNFCTRNKITNALQYENFRNPKEPIKDKRNYEEV